MKNRESTKYLGNQSNREIETDTRGEEISRKLSSSPLFNLSLASRELFHSNFISWLCNTYKCEMGKLFSEYVLNGKNIENCVREAKRADIKITFDSTEVLIIENKVKSVPNESQLRDYEKKFETNGLLLLTMTQPGFEFGKWKVLPYDEFLKQLRIHFLNDKSKLTDAYNYSLIEDYVNFTSLLLESFNQFNNFRDFTFKDYYSRLEPFRKIRIYDMILKRTYEAIAHDIKERIEEIFGNGNLFFNHNPPNNGQLGTAIIRTGFVHGKSFVTTDLYTEEYHSIFISLDANRIEVGVSRKDEKSAKDYFDRIKGQLFDTIKIEELEFIKYRKPKKRYGKFGKGSAMYRWREVNEDVTIGNTIDEVCKLIKLINSQFNVSN